MLDGPIDPKLFEIKNKEMTFRRTQIACLLKDNIQADGDFKDALSKTISIAAKSYDIFDSSKTDEKRNLLGFVFLNLQLEGTTLRYTLRKPFEQFAQLPNNPEWRATRDEEWHHSVKLDGQ